MNLTHAAVRRLAPVRRLRRGGRSPEAPRRWLRKGRGGPPAAVPEERCGAPGLAAAESRRGRRGAAWARSRGAAAGLPNGVMFGKCGWEEGRGGVYCDAACAPQGAHAGRLHSWEGASFFLRRGGLARGSCRCAMVGSCRCVIFLILSVFQRRQPSRLAPAPCQLELALVVRTMLLAVLMFWCPGRQVAAACAADCFRERSVMRCVSTAVGVHSWVLALLPVDRHAHGLRAQARRHWTSAPAVLRLRPSRGNVR